MRRAQTDRRAEIIDHLRQNPRPVDAVHARQPHPVAEGEIVEHILHAGLTIVKIAIHRQRMHIRLDRRRHLAALHLGHPAMRIKDEHIHIAQAAKRLDRRRSGIAAGGANNRDPLARLGPATACIIWPISCMAKSLNASVGPWNSSSRKWFGASCTNGARAAWPKPA